jgi:hypothetical protein
MRATFYHGRRLLPSPAVQHGGRIKLLQILRIQWKHIDCTGNIASALAFPRNYMKSPANRLSSAINLQWDCASLKAAVVSAKTSIPERAF